MFRHLPPTATPIHLGELRHGLSPTGSLDRFRIALARYLGAPHCFLASSGRTALYLLLVTLRDTRRDAARREVVLPAYTCPSLGKVVLDAGLELRLVDLDPATLIFDEAGLAQTVGERTLAVIAVHPFGIPQEMGSLRTLARARGALLIEDAAQSMGATFSGRRVGTMGDAGLYSLGPGKPLSTGGGGIVCTGDRSLADRLAASWRTLAPATGRANAVSWLRLAVFNSAFHPAGWYWATRLGAQRAGESEANWGYRLTGLSEAQAAVGLTLLRRLDALNGARRARGEQLRRGVQGVSGVQAIGPAGPQRDEAGPIYLRFPLLAADERLRDDLYGALQRAGIGAGKLYGRSMADFFAGHVAGSYPGAEAVARRLLTLPTHGYVTEGDVGRMVEIVARTANSKQL